MRDAGWTSSTSLLAAPTKQSQVASQGRLSRIFRWQPAFHRIGPSTALRVTPVTLKMRLGWDDDNSETRPELGPASLEALGVR